MHRRLKLFIAMSLDGMIAAPGDDLGFLQKAELPGEDYGYAAFCETIDCVWIGRKTYEKVLSLVPEFPHRCPVYVFTGTRTGQAGNIHFYGGEPAALLHSLRSQPGRDIYCDGGGVLIAALLRERLVDEMILTVIPVLLGAGTPLFAGGYPPQDLEQVQCRTWENGVVQLHYRRRDPQP